MLTGSFFVAVALGLTACASDAATEETPVPPTVEVDPPASEEGSDTPSENQSEGDAMVDDVINAALAGLDLAESDTGGIAYELSDDDDETQWEIDINDNGSDIEVHINWAGTEVLRTETNDRVDDDKLVKLDTAEITIQQAITEAANHATGQLDEAEVDDENGVVVWEVSFDDGPRDTKVYIDAQTGEVLKVNEDD